MVKQVAVALVGILLAAQAGTAQAQGQAQVKDHPLVSRFAGSTVEEHSAAEFDSLVFPLGPVLDHDRFVKMQTLEGRVTKFKYSVPTGRSGLEIARSYQNALQQAGFQILFTCDGKDACFSPKFPSGYNMMSSGLWCYSCGEATRYVGAKLARPTGDAYVSVVVNIDKYGALSNQRAEAVVAALTTQYKVAAGRLAPSGIGPLAPVATNRTEDGRARNRRVELVEQ